MSKFHTPEKVIYVCTGGKCSKRGGKDLCKSLKAYTKQLGLKDEIEVIKVECTDRCKFAPVLSIQPNNIWLKEYTEREVFGVLEKIWKE